MAECLYLSTVSVAEPLLGVESLPIGKRRKSLAAPQSQLIVLFGERILSFDLAVAKACPQVVTRARRDGYLIAEADAQIAAIAFSRGFGVATRDEARFQAEGFTVINPWTARIQTS